MRQSEKYLNSYIDYLSNELNYSIKTIENYKLDIIQYYKILDEIKINFLDIDKDGIREYLKKIETNSNKTISRKLSSLRSYYSFLVEVSLIKENIYMTIKNPKVEKKLPNFLTEEESDILLTSFKLDNFYEVRNYLLLELIYSCGLRLSEVINISIQNININNKQIKIMGKGNKERYVYYGDYVSEYLNIYMNKYYYIYNIYNNEYLFINKYGKKISNSMVHKIIKNQKLKCGLSKNISAHSLRHSFATDLLNNGASIDTVKKLLGHSSLSTTQIYTHVASDKIKNEYIKAHPRSVKK